MRNNQPIRFGEERRTTWTQGQFPWTERQNIYEENKNRREEANQLPKFTEEPEKGHTRVMYTPQTPLTTDNELSEKELEKEMYDKNKNRNKFSKKPYSRRGRKQKNTRKGNNIQE